MNHVVIFDGTRNRPWGQYLDADPEIQRSAPQLRPPDPSSNCAKVLQCLADRPLLRSEIAQSTGLNPAQVNGSLGELIRRGHVRAETTKTRKARFGGITVSVRYHAVGKWEQ